MLPTPVSTCVHLFAKGRTFFAIDREFRRIRTTRLFANHLVSGISSQAFHGILFKTVQQLWGQQFCGIIFLCRRELPGEESQLEGD